MITKPEGTQDLFGDEAEEWQNFEYAAKMVLEHEGFRRCEPPTFEKEELFVRGLGESTDVVNKEMFSVFSGGNLAKMQAGEQISSKSKFALRPEGTAGVVRAAIENGFLDDPEQQPLRVWYAGPMFRAERPQKGRFREFRQLGLECLGSDDAYLDAQAIVIMSDIFMMYGIDNAKVEVHLNTMGCDECRPAWREAVREYIDAHAGEMCETCVERAKKNPLRAFDCKNENCKRVMKDAPKITDFLCLECRTHFEKVKRLLNTADVEYVLDPALVRGLDYYTRTVFEAQFSDGLGAQNAIGGGGRYDRLVDELGGKSTPALGFAIGFERCLLAKRACGSKLNEFPGPDFFFIVTNDDAKKFAEEFSLNPNQCGDSFDFDFRPTKKGEPKYRSIKSQLRLANKVNASYAVILGEEEMHTEIATVKNLRSHEESKVPFSDLKSSTIRGQMTMEAWDFGLH